MSKFVTKTSNFKLFKLSKKFCNAILDNIILHIDKVKLSGSFFVQSFQHYAVKPLNSGHLWFLEYVSAIERCPLWRGSKYKSSTVAGDNWLLVMVSAIERCPL